MGLLLHNVQTSIVDLSHFRQDPKAVVISRLDHHAARDSWFYSKPDTVFSLYSYHRGICCRKIYSGGSAEPWSFALGSAGSPSAAGGGRWLGLGLLLSGFFVDSQGPLVVVGGAKLPLPWRSHPLMLERHLHSEWERQPKIG